MPKKHGICEATVSLGLKTNLHSTILDVYAGWQSAQNFSIKSLTLPRVTVFSFWDQREVKGRFPDQSTDPYPTK